MKVLTEKQRQWLWFTGLWCGGLIAFLFIAYLARWLISIL
jgi:hypothetical protein